jgi:hypothetical protein
MKQSATRRDGLCKSSFPEEGERYDDETVLTLMAEYTVGSSECQERAEAIAGLVRGPRLRHIYNLFRYDVGSTTECQRRLRCRGS